MPQFRTPILLLIFNRPDTTRLVFEQIKKIKPSKLFIAADGPREDRLDEKEKCEETRKIVKQIDWPCEVHERFSDTNLGCKIGVSSAINWFFENVEEGIILEDDCLPNPSFFSFCQELLSKYRNAEKVKMISGDNFHFGKKLCGESYYFSNIPNIWGWATWKRAWQEYDLSMKTYPDFKRNNDISRVFKDKKKQKYWLKLFDSLYNSKINTWDGQWVYTIYKNNGLSITPSVNLISNIGFEANATHTKIGSVLSNIPAENLEIIIHPESIIVNVEIDNIVFKTIFHRSIFKKITDKVRLNLKI